jgi:tRNA dimethylallyltransferase
VASNKSSENSIFKPLIVIIGPTGVGKTQISLKLAQRLKGEIVSADSRLFYRGMDIGTAKPTPEERARIPHHLIDVAKPDQVWNLAKFQRAALEAIDLIQAKGRIPFLVGGTGQYVRAIVEGWSIPKVKPNPRLRRALKKWANRVSPEGLHSRLARLDPEAAGRIDPPNLRRTVRAMEVILRTGKRFSTQRSSEQSPYQILQIGLVRPRPELYARIDERIRAMLEAGFIDEVRDLLEQGYSPSLPPLSAIGYRQIIAYLHGDLSLDEAVSQIKRLTRQFVRKQANWFKIDDPNIHWYRVRPGVEDIIESHIREFLSGGKKNP